MISMNLRKANIILLSLVVLGMLWIFLTAARYEREIRTFIPISPETLREFMDKPIQELDGC